VCSLGRRCNRDRLRWRLVHVRLGCESVGEWQWVGGISDLPAAARGPPEVRAMPARRMGCLILRRVVRGVVRGP
jgi:hypothetical protein